MHQRCDACNRSESCSPKCAIQTVLTSLSGCLSVKSRCIHDNRLTQGCYMCRLLSWHSRATGHQEQSGQQTNSFLFYMIFLCSRNNNPIQVFLVQYWHDRNRQCWAIMSDLAVYIRYRFIFSSSTHHIKALWCENERTTETVTKNITTGRVKAISAQKHKRPL